jgi:hypothetical protein
MIAISAAVRSTDASTDVFSSFFQHRKRNPAARAALLRSIEAFGNGASPIHARMRVNLSGLDEGTTTEGHELELKTTKRIPKVTWALAVARPVDRDSRPGGHAVGRRDPSAPLAHVGAAILGVDGHLDHARPVVALRSG